MGDADSLNEVLRKNMEKEENVEEVEISVKAESKCWADRSEGKKNNMGRGGD